MILGNATSTPGPWLGCIVRNAFGGVTIGSRGGGMSELLWAPEPFSPSDCQNWSRDHVGNRGPSASPLTNGEIVCQPIANALH